MTNDDYPTIPVGRYILYGVVALVLFILISLGGCAGTKAFTRYQSRSDRNQNRTQARFDAENQVRINQIRIGYFKQELQITKQQASIRQAKAVGIREAQDKIAKTLTPLYVQFEMVQALQQIALSGRNSTIVYLPTGASGIPLISNAAGQVQLPR